MSDDPACLVAHGDAATPSGTDGGADSPVLVAVFATSVATHLTHFARHLGWHTVVIDPAGVPADLARTVDAVGEALDPAVVAGADVVLTDHHRDDLGPLLRDALTADARWVGIMGNPRHEGPHVAALRGLGVTDNDIGRVHRPIGLDIGSHTPAEIALSTLAGLVADRNGRAGGLPRG